jgi:hypothetical protein
MWDRKKERKKKRKKESNKQKDRKKELLWPLGVTFRYCIQTIHVSLTFLLCLKRKMEKKLANQKLSFIQKFRNKLTSIQTHKSVSFSFLHKYYRFFFLFVKITRTTVLYISHQCSLIFMIFNPKAHKSSWSYCSLKKQNKAIFCKFP